jgi:hypothetical protein
MVMRRKKYKSQLIFCAIISLNLAEAHNQVFVICEYHHIINLVVEIGEGGRKRAQQFMMRDVEG